ncbi:hypothetical protein CEXT_328001 [Caerostris extrusa]|uniref:FIIND domain-containing protein n=1 Tax=Caerostris extrusa TaxID=172846 RepID=A0AAV4WSW1_CAEEX|nr:hypothetical protein CEXT_328001 [Caerostris extrusa]
MHVTCRGSADPKFLPVQCSSHQYLCEKEKQMREPNVISHAQQTTSWETGDILLPNQAFSSSHVDLHLEQKRIKLSSPDILIQFKSTPSCMGTAVQFPQRGDVAVKVPDILHFHILLPTHLADFQVCLMDSLIDVRDNHILFTEYEM